MTKTNTPKRSEGASKKARSSTFKLGILSTLMLLMNVALVPAASADVVNVRAYCADTVAGYASTLKTSMIDPGKKVTFVIEKPDASVTQIPAVAGLDGVATTDLYGFQTKFAGLYKVAVSFPGTLDYSPQSTCSVYPDQVSPTQSMLGTSVQLLAADGNSKTFVTVTLFDANRNPVSNHTVQLISSRSDDTIAALKNKGVTDAAGRASFAVSSRYAGISVFTAVDLSTNMILTDRQEVVFQVPVLPSAAMGGNDGGGFLANLFKADIGGDPAAPAAAAEVLPGPVDHFDITDLPSQIKVGADQTITVISRDKDGNVAKNYTGTIIFSVVDDDNAVLPSNGEYTFKENDQGQFTFNLAIRFSKIGKQTVQVFDKQNFKIAGSKDVEVVPEGGVIHAPVSSKIQIKSPVDGSQLGSNMIVLTGQGDPDINLKVFDNDAKIGDSGTDKDGFFTYQAKDMVSGPHSFFVMTDDGLVSPTITVQVDTIPPVLNTFTVTPDGVVTPGQSLSFVAESEPNLQDAKIRVQGTEQPLSPGATPGTYTATMAAPATEGSFPVDVILIDQLSNKAELLGKATVQVKAAEQPAPPQVQGLAAGVGVDSQLLLTWTAVTGAANDIVKYRVHYGIAFDKLTQVAETTGPVTTFTLANLVNGTQYFAAVGAVDSKGKESDPLSVTIAATPLPPVVMPPVPTPVPVTPATVGAGLQGVSMNGGVQLTWNAFSTQPAYFYKIYFGLTSHKYDDYVVTPTNAANGSVPDLINGIPYYFSVVALDLNSQEISGLSDEISVVPGGAQALPAPSATLPPDYGFPPSAVHPAAGYPPYTSQLTSVPSTQKTGPETVWVILSAFILAQFFYQHKRKIINSTMTK